MAFLKGNKILPAILILVSITIYACSKGGNSAGGGINPPPTDQKALDRKAMLTNIADNIVIPGYAKFKVKLDVLVAKSNAFTTTPTTATLTDFRAAWVDAYTEWQKVELFDFGPGQTQAIRSFFNIYPANETGIMANILAGSATNFDVPAAYPTEGFPALDFLLNGLGSTDAAILVYYTSDVNAAKRLAYVKLITDKMNSVFTKVNGDWTSYRTEFISKTGTDAGSSSAIMVNSFVLNFEKYIRSGKFGIPSGAMLNGVVSAGKVEALYKKDISNILAKAAFQATVDFFNGKGVTTGTEGPSLKTYLDGLSAKDSSTGTSLTQTLNTQFTTITTKMNLLGNNLYNEVNTNNIAMIAVYTEMQKAVRMLKVDMTSAMSITITYTDNDGD